LEEVFVKINGVQHYLWRAVDHEGEVLESYVTKTRDKELRSCTYPSDIESER
jgi:putative transposase